MKALAYTPYNIVYYDAGYYNIDFIRVISMYVDMISNKKNYQITKYIF